MMSPCGKPYDVHAKRTDIQHKGECFIHKLYLYIVKEINNDHLNAFVHRQNIYFVVKNHFRPSDKSRDTRFTFYKRHFVMVLFI